MAGYGTDEGFAAWLVENGYDEPTNYEVPAALRQRGSAYIDAVYGPRFPGVPAGGYAQERAWPRTGATVHGAEIPGSAVPVAVINASYFAAYQEGMEPGSLGVVATSAGQIKREKVGPLETEYHAPAGDALAAATPMMLVVEGLLRPLLSGPGVGFYLV